MKLSGDLLQRNFPGRRAAPRSPPTKQHLPDWNKLLDTNRPLWERAKRAATRGPRVLLATNVAGHSPATVVESVLAVALTLRGAKVHTLVCDKVLPACLRAQVDNVLDLGTFERYELSRVLCDACYAVGQYTYEPLGLAGHLFSQLIADEDRDRARQLAQSIPPDDMPDFRQDGLALGEHAYAGTLRFFARGDLREEPRGEVVFRRYFEAALLTATITQALLRRYRFDVACFHHGIYVPQGITGEVCRQSGLRVVNWNPAFRNNCFIFSHGDSYHHTLLDEPVGHWDNLAWTPDMEDQILGYLKSRWYGSRDWIWFHERPDEDFSAYAQKVGLNLSKPCIGLLTNVIWDAQLHYRANAFPNMLSWLFQTIGYFERRPELQLVIRVHPAEIRGTARSRQPVIPEIERAFPALPRNVFIIPPESAVSTYAAMMRCNAVIIYGTKTGVELTSMGIPVVVAGEAWIRNKGLTIDASTPAQYLQILDQLRPLPDKLDPAVVTRARKYAYHFFFRRMIPLPFIAPAPHWPPYDVALPRLDELLPGVYPGLDTICDGILTGSPFIYPAETLGVHDA